EFTALPDFARRIDQQVAAIFAAHQSCALFGQRDMSTGAGKKYPLQTSSSFIPRVADPWIMQQLWRAALEFQLWSARGTTRSSERASISRGPIGETTMMKRILLATLFAGLTAFSAKAQQNLPSGTEIKVRTDTSIPAKPAADTRYAASVSEDVKDSSGNVVIPRGSRARLIAVPSNDGKDTNLDLRSVTVNGTPYLIDAAGSGDKGTPGGLGAN